MTSIYVIEGHAIRHSDTAAAAVDASTTDILTSLFERPHEAMTAEIYFKCSYMERRKR